MLSGPLPREALLTAAEQLVSVYSTDLGSAAKTYHGPATVRFTVQSDGSVGAASLILDRVRQLGGPGPSVDEMLAGLVARVTQLEFEPSSAETRVSLPFGFG